MVTKQMAREVAREKILNAALEIFAQQGYHGSKMSQISRKAGVSAGLAYHYFEGKEEILDAILAKNVELHQPLFEAIRRGGLDIPGIIDVLADIIVSHSRFIRLNLALAMQPDALDEKRRSLAVFFGKIQRILLQAFKAAGVPEPENEARVLMSVVLGLVLGQTMQLRGFSLDQTRAYLRRKYKSGAK